MFGRRCIIICSCILASISGTAQVNPADSIPPVVDESLLVDTSLDYDALLDELGDFLDSLLEPRSYLLANLSAASGYFNYTDRTNTRVFVQKKLIFSPTIGYYHKSGPGLTLSGNMIRSKKNYNFYQYSITPSFDFIQSRKWTGGLSYSRFITKDSLGFYTTPLQNEFAGNFLWRKAWLQPGISASYGWGSRTDLTKRTVYIKNIILEQEMERRPNLSAAQTLLLSDSIVTTITTRESIADFLLTASIRHSFYWLHLSKNNDYIRFTPMLALSCGTQQFGFNQTRVSAITVRNTANVQFNRGDANLNEKLQFQPMSLTLYLSPEYFLGKFFIQPQLILDYYFPGNKNNLTSFFTVNTGFMF